MSLASQILSLATRIGQECKALWTAVNGKAASNHNHDSSYLGINSSANRTKLLDVNNADGQESSLQFMQLPGDTAGNDNPFGTWTHIIKLNHGNGDTYYSRVLAIEFFGNRIFTRRREGGNVSPWVQLWDSDSFNPSSKENTFSKNTAFNKNFGNAAGTVCEGNDSRLSDVRTPTDSSVTYAKVASSLTGRATDNDGAWDFSAHGIIDAAFSSNMGTLSFSNLQTNKVLKMKLVITNSATFSFPAGFSMLEGSAAASGTNGTYFIYFDCWSSSAPEVLVSISKIAS